MIGLIAGVQLAAFFATHNEVKEALFSEREEYYGGIFMTFSL